MASPTPQILVTGGTGFIGRALLPALIGQGYHLHVLTRQAPTKLAAMPSVSYFHNFHQLPDPLPEKVINLSGLGIAQGRWTPRRKRELVASRCGVTDDLLKLYIDREQAPLQLISGSAVGYYGPHGDNLLSESTKAHTSFSHELCGQWETAAFNFEALGTRVCCLRMGVVLGAGGGALSKMTIPFNLGLGGVIGSGRQWMSWISMVDLISLILFCLKHETLQGPVNATAPYPVTNDEFTKTLAAHLGRPALLPIPELVAKLLFGQMGDELLLQGQRVIPEVAVAAGFTFKYPRLKGALSEIYNHTKKI